MSTAAALLSRYGTSVSREHTDVYRVGVDIGGTFTDVVVASGEGKIIRAKALTTPGDYTEGVVAALVNAAERRETTVEALIADCAAFVNERPSSRMRSRSSAGDASDCLPLPGSSSR